jgi:glycine cleavage system H protein
VTAPGDLRYSAEHEWAKATEDGSAVRIGITDFAQQQLGDIVYVSLPAVGTQLDAGAAMGEVESTKSVSDLFAPIAGTVLASNAALEDNPELVNSDPYGDGWMVEIAIAEPSALDAMLSAAAYQGMVNPH